MLKGILGVLFPLHLNILIGFSAKGFANYNVLAKYILQFTVFLEVLPAESLSVSSSSLISFVSLLIRLGCLVESWLIKDEAEFISDTNPEILRSKSILHLLLAISRFPRSSCNL